MKTEMLINIRFAGVDFVSFEMSHVRLCEKISYANINIIGLSVLSSVLLLCGFDSSGAAM